VGLKKKHKHILSLPVLVVSVSCALLLGGGLRASAAPETALWLDAISFTQEPADSEAWVQPKVFRPVNLQHAQLRPLLESALRETVQNLSTSDTIITLPMPDGTEARFRFVEAPVMDPKLAAWFPEIKTYVGRGLDDPAATLRFDLTPAGFHAQVLSPNGAVYIEPYLRGNTNLHAAYYRRDYQPAAQDFQCLGSGIPAAAASAPSADLVISGGTLRTYRLACAATAQYSQYFGGTVSAALSAMVTAINRVNGIYETEVGIRLMLVAGNDQIIYTNATSQPYSNGDPYALIYQNQANLDAVIGSANYDIGHVFSTGGGGLAAVGVVGLTGLKAQGETGTYPPVGDGFYIDYVAHEIGHQFGATHSFNSSANACGYGNRFAASAYEPGSGSTIMSYAGICGTDNLQPHSAPYFHSITLEQILGYTGTPSGGGTLSPNAAGNSPPVVDAGPGYTIPIGTPFTLTATGSDPDGDALTYCWEERDLGPSITLWTPDNGSSPLFRSFDPTTSPSRTFPRWSGILNGTTTAGERLPTTSRILNFRVIARDNQPGGGGVAVSDLQLTVTTNSGPFAVTAPAAAAIWSGTRPVTWDVAGTTNAPVQAATVSILLSTNGGLDFPIVLASQVPNTGACTVVLPPLSTSAARIKVEADDNIFFAVSPGDFSLIYDPPPVLQPLEYTEGATKLIWTAVSGRTYRVQYKPSLAAVDWTDLLPHVTATGPLATFTDSSGSAAQRFYRVLVLP